MLVDIRSMLNVGAMFRTTVGANLDKLILSGYTATPPREEISKTALGTVDQVDWEYHQNPLAYIEQAKKDGFRVVAIENNTKYDEQDLFDYKPQLPTVIIFGNEMRGLPESVLMKCDDVVKIPMYGPKESLNIATAYGIVAYDFARKRLGK